MKSITFFIGTVLFLVACSSDPKTVVVMSKGNADIDLNAGTIGAKDGSGHVEKIINMNNKKVSFKLNTPAGEATVDLLENGLYVVNVKNDTIIGSYQKYTSADKAQNMITQESLKQKIDSLKLLVEGKNVTPANRNYFILPNQATRITDNPNAQIVGPYHQMRSAEKIDGKDPEIYRFYSIKEIREMIIKLTALTVAPVK
jgi:archaellum component FlaF (FlaF/FlaG flagellin family)